MTVLAIRHLLYYSLCFSSVLQGYEIIILSFKLYGFGFHVEVSQSIFFLFFYFKEKKNLRKAR